jgi:hypothetical protein
LEILPSRLQAFPELTWFIVYELWRGATEVNSPGKLTRIFGLGFLTLIMNHLGILHAPCRGREKLLLPAVALVLMTLREKLTGEWRRLHNEKLYNMYSSPYINWLIKSRRRSAGHVTRMRKRRGTYRHLVGKLQGKGPLGRPRRKWEDNTKMDL